MSLENHSKYVSEDGDDLIIRVPPGMAAVLFIKDELHNQEVGEGYYYDVVVNTPKDPAQIPDVIYHTDPYGMVMIVHELFLAYKEAFVARLLLWQNACKRSDAAALSERERAEKALFQARVFDTRKMKEDN